MANINDLDFQFKEIADERTLTLLEKIGRALPIIRDAIPKQLKLPDIFHVRVDNAIKVDGEIRARISNPVVRVSNLQELQTYFAGLQQQLANMTHAISLIAVQKPQQMPEIKIPTLDTTPLIDAINNIPGAADNSNVISAIMGVQEAIAVLANRPQMTSQPVTHISINALNGAVKTSQIQLGSTVTALPAVALANRRALQFYNNGSNPIYFGGSNVSTANGIPVGSGAYSDILDLGVNVLVYGISGTGQNNDIRVLEVSDEASGR